MNPTVARLVEQAERDPLPAAHTSLVWQQYGAEVVAKQEDGALRLRPAGFASLPRPTLRGRAVWAVERSLHARATRSLESFPEVWRSAQRLARDLRGGANFHVFKFACALAVLTDHWRRHGLSPKTFALIGDGEGFLGALIGRRHPEARLYYVDLPRQLVFQAATQERANPGRSLGVPAREGALQARCVFVPPGEIEAVRETVDCAINIDSMQEMRPESIAAYFAFLRRRSAPASRFYCVNRERKAWIVGEAAVFEAYPWQAEDTVLLDGPYPYHRWFVDPETRPNGPRAFGVRIPFVNAWSPVRHRLAQLARIP